MNIREYKIEKWKIDTIELLGLKIEEFPAFRAFR